MKNIHKICGAVLCLALVSLLCVLPTAPLTAAAAAADGIEGAEFPYVKCDPIGAWFELPAGEKTEDPLRLTDSMRVFYDQTGVQPYLIAARSEEDFIADMAAPADTETSADVEGAVPAAVFPVGGADVSGALEAALLLKYAALFGDDEGHAIVLLFEDALAEARAQNEWDESFLLGEEDDGDDAALPAEEPTMLYYCIGRSAAELVLDKDARALLSDAIVSELLWTQELSEALSSAFENAAWQIEEKMNGAMQDDGVFFDNEDNLIPETESDNLGVAFAVMFPFLFGAVFIVVGIYFKTKKKGAAPAKRGSAPMQPPRAGSPFVPPAQTRSAPVPPVQSGRYPAAPVPPVKSGKYPAAPAAQKNAGPQPQDRRLQYPITCPACKATAYPNADGTCQYCGGRLI